MEDRATFDVVVLCGLVISKLLTSIDEPVKVRPICADLVVWNLQRDNNIPALRVCPMEGVVFHVIN